MITGGESEIGKLQRWVFQHPWKCSVLLGLKISSSGGWAEQTSEGDLLISYNASKSFEWPQFFFPVGIYEVGFLIKAC